MSKSSHLARNCQRISSRRVNVLHWTVLSKCVCLCRWQEKPCAGAEFSTQRHGWALQGQPFNSLARTEEAWYNIYIYNIISYIYNVIIYIYTIYYIYNIIYYIYNIIYVYRYMYNEKTDSDYLQSYSWTLSWTAGESPETPSALVPGYTLLGPGQCQDFYQTTKALAAAPRASDIMWRPK